MEKFFIFFFFDSDIARDGQEISFYKRAANSKKEEKKNLFIFETGNMNFIFGFGFTLYEIRKSGIFKKYFFLSFSKFHTFLFLRNCASLFASFWHTFWITNSAGYYHKLLYVIFCRKKTIYWPLVLQYTRNHHKYLLLVWLFISSCSHCIWQAVKYFTR